MVEILRRAAELKRRHPDTILFFRLGDFYEVFAEDARLIARELNLILTSRPTGDGDHIAMAGVPDHSLEQTITRLLARGHRVAVAEEVSDSADRSSGTGHVPDVRGTTLCPDTDPAASQLLLPFDYTHIP